MVQFGVHAFSGDASRIPIKDPTSVVSYSPLALTIPGRAVNMQLRVTAPATGTNLPILLLSHGHGSSNWLSSLDGYGAMYDFYAAHGFVVLQPTHLNSKFLSLQHGLEHGKLFWRTRAQDMMDIIDRVDEIEKSVPLLQGRLDKTRIAVFGHSLGAWTAAMLLGAGNVDPRDGSTTRLFDKRIKAGVVVAGLGNGGPDLSDNGCNRLVPFYGPQLCQVETPALIVYGDEDVSPHLSNRGADWHADIYTQSPGPKDLLVVSGAKHGLGGISGFDAAETLDASPERLLSVQRMTWAYLWSQLTGDESAWTDACDMVEEIDRLGRVWHKNTE